MVSFCFLGHNMSLNGCKMRCIYIYIIEISVYIYMYYIYNAMYMYNVMYICVCLLNVLLSMVTHYFPHQLRSSIFHFETKPCPHDVRSAWGSNLGWMGALAWTRVAWRGGRYLDSPKQTYNEYIYIYIYIYIYTYVYTYIYICIY